MSTAIQIRANPDLARRVAREMQAREQKSIAKTAAELLIERLTQLEMERANQNAQPQNAAS